VRVDISVVVGNPKPRSRTLTIAEAVATQIAGERSKITRVIDLCDFASDLFTWPHDAVSALNQQVAASDVVVFASPTYKAAYTGMLKAFLDRYPSNGLAGVVAVAVMTGGSSHHSMAVDTALRPLLVELGASVPSRGLYFEMSQIERLEDVIDEWAAQNLEILRRALNRNRN
jgi:FMN reductase